MAKTKIYKMRTSERLKKEKAEKKKKILVIIMSAVGLLIAGIVALLIVQVRTVKATGIAYYSDEEVREFIFDGEDSRSVLLVFLDKFFGEEKDIPFVDSYSVEFTGFTSIKVKLEAKSMVGYVEFINSNLYFNRDGLVVESTHELYPDIPKITGLDLDSVVLGEVLPTKSKTVLNELLEISQFLSSTSVSWSGEDKTLINIVERIHFDTNDEINCYVGDIIVALGTGYNLEKKLREMADILPAIEGRSGTLHLEGYTDVDSNHIYTFE